MTVGGSALSTVKPTARDKAVMLLERSCTEARTSVAFSTTRMVAATLTLAAVTLRVMAAGSTPIDAARFTVSLCFARLLKASTVPAKVITRSISNCHAPPGVSGGGEGGGGDGGGDAGEGEGGGGNGGGREGGIGGDGGPCGDDTVVHRPDTEMSTRRK